MLVHRPSILDLVLSLCIEGHSLPMLNHNFQHIIVDNGFLNLYGPCPTRFGHVGVSFARFCYVFLKSYLLLLQVRLFLSTQMVHNMTPCKRSQILPSLLRAKGIFFPRIPCCQSNGFHGLTIFGCHRVDDVNGKIPCSKPKIYVQWFPKCQHYTYDICCQHQQ